MELQESIDRLAEAVARIAGGAAPQQPTEAEFSSAVESLLDRLASGVVALVKRNAAQAATTPQGQPGPKPATTGPAATASPAPTPPAAIQSGQALLDILFNLIRLNQFFQRAALTASAANSQPPASGGTPAPSPLPSIVQHLTGSMMTPAVLASLAGNQQPQQQPPPAAVPMTRAAKRAARRQRRRAGLKQVGQGLTQAMSRGGRTQGLKQAGRGVMTFFGSGAAGGGAGGAAGSVAAGAAIGRVAGPVAAAGVALYKFVRAANDAADQQLNAMKKYAQSSAAMSLVLSQLEMSESFRNMRIGNRLTDSAKDLAEAKKDFQKSTENLEVVAEKVQNWFAKKLEQVATVIVKPIDRLAANVDKLANGQQDDRAKEIALGNWLIEVQEDTDRTRARSDQWFNREKFE